MNSFQSDRKWYMSITSLRLGLSAVLLVALLANCPSWSHSAVLDCAPACPGKQICVLLKDGQKPRCIKPGEKDSYGCSTVKRGPIYLNGPPCGEGLICFRQIQDPLFPRKCIKRLFEAHVDGTPNSPH